VQALAYNLSDPTLKLNPWPLYERLRDEAPVLLAKAPTEDRDDVYVVSRYDDVAMVLRDKKRFSSHISDGVVSGEFLDLPAMINRDAPVHTRLRRVANRSLGPRALAPLTEKIQQEVDELVGELLSRPEVEFVEQFTTELPLRVMGGLMLGIPIERKAELQRWSEAVLESAGLIAGGDPDLVPGCVEDFLALINFVEVQATGRVGCPHRGDVLSDLVEREAAGELSHDEVVSLGWSYVAAGQDTTMNLLGGGLQLLLTDQALAERLIADPERTTDFIDEYLRIYSPTQVVWRRTAEEVELHGVVIPARSFVHVLIGSANRDPRMFPDPDVFDLDRPNSADHLAFGAGAHYCPGGVLGKLLGELAFRALYPHLSRLSLDPARPPRLRVRPGSFGIEHMGILISQDTPAMAD
jgi:cytochrome P450